MKQLFERSVLAKRYLSRSPNLGSLVKKLRPPEQSKPLARKGAFNPPKNAGRPAIVVGRRMRLGKR